MEGPDSSTKAVIQEGAPFWTKTQMSVKGRTVHPRIINIHREQPRSKETLGGGSYTVRDQRTDLGHRR